MDHKFETPRISGHLLQVIKSEKKVGKKCVRPFLKGPIPIHWLVSARKASPTALMVGLLLWYLSGLEKNKTIKITNHKLNLWGLDRQAKYRGLIKLEDAGLIKVKRHGKTSPVVTILNGDINTTNLR